MLAATKRAGDEKPKNSLDRPIRAELAFKNGIDSLLCIFSRKQQAHSNAAYLPPTQPALPRILVVDDAYSVRNSLRQLLQDAGYAVDSARDGLEAIASLQAQGADLLLTDLEMPHMNGAQLCSHLRASADWQALPIIMISSRTQDKHRQLAADAGVSAYLGKPYAEAELLALIAHLLAKNPQ